MLDYEASLLHTTAHFLALNMMSLPARSQVGRPEVALISHGLRRNASVSFIHVLVCFGLYKLVPYGRGSPEYNIYVFWNNLVSRQIQGIWASLPWVRSTCLGVVHTAAMTSESLVLYQPGKGIDQYRSIIHIWRLLWQFLQFRDSNQFNRREGTTSAWEEKSSL